MAAFSFIFFALAAFSSSTFATFTSERFALSVASSSTHSEILSPAQHIVNLTSKAPRRRYKAAALRSLSKKQDRATLQGAADDEEYLAPINIGGQAFEVIVDTGSSDTWLAEKGVKCVSPSGQAEPLAECAFGTKGFDPHKSKTFKTDPNHNFNISYGSGEILSGTVAFETVTVGGLTVSHQEIGVVNKAAWEGDGINTGLMGLAFSADTSVFRGTDLSKDNRTDPASREPYSPLFFSAIKQKKVNKPIFSIAINRGTFAKEANSTIDRKLGVLAFGGIAPVPVTNKTVTVPIQGFKVTGSDGPVLVFYAVEVDELVLAGSRKLETKIRPILDSGTLLNLVPTDVAKQYNELWTPPAQYDADKGIYVVPCNATAPAFSVVIAGKAFTVDPRDNVIPSTDETGKVTCISGTQDGGANTPDNIFILGDVFLRNVVTTFNVGTNTTTLTQRQPY